MLTRLRFQRKAGLFCFFLLLQFLFHSSFINKDKNCLVFGKNKLNLTVELTVHFSILLETLTLLYAHCILFVYSDERIEI